MKREDRTVAIEVKSARQLRPEHLKGPRAISELAGLHRRLLVYQGERVLKTSDNIDVLPFLVFSEMLAEDRLWS